MNIGDDDGLERREICPSRGIYMQIHLLAARMREEDSGGGQYLSITLHAILGEGEGQHFHAENVGHKFHQDLNPKCTLGSLSQQRSLVRFELV